jgi:prophage regulatory protein
MIKLRRRPFLLQTFGISKSTLQNRINEGLVPPPIPIGDRAVAWPSNEVESIVNAQIAKKSNDEIKTLVKVLIEKRASEEV